MYSVYSVAPYVLFLCTKKDGEKRDIKNENKLSVANGFSALLGTTIYQKEIQTMFYQASCLVQILI